MGVVTALPVRYAADWLYLPEQAVTTAIIVQTVLAVCIWILSPEIERQTAEGLWNLWAFGSERMARALIHRCRRCGHLSSNRVAADDNPMKLMSIAMKPLSQPPFPLEKIEEMTTLMGGDGQLSYG